MTPPADFTRRRVAVAGGFATQGLVFIALSTKLPAIQDRFGIGPGEFSALLLALVIAAGAGSLAAEQLAPRRGSDTTLRIGFALMVIALPVVGFSHQLWVLAVGMALYGGALGMVDATTNMQGVTLEHAAGRPIMPSFHAAWTLGGIVGTLLALALTHVSLGVAALILALLPLGATFLPYLRAADPSAPRPPIDRPPVVLEVPWRRILVVGAALVLFYMVDTAVTTWGPTYVDRTFDAPGPLVAVATLPYLAASLVGRGSGDRLAARFGATPLLRVGACVGAVGLAIVVLAPSSYVAMAGFVVLGTGVAVVAPLSFSAAASIAHEGSGLDPAAERARVDAVIARFNQFNYLGAVLGSVMTGAVGKDSLRYGFAVPMVLILGIVPLARAFGRDAAATVE
ncbi:MFS transporter [Allobranchiibius sp. CTAmp26]|uniref:MFS transporter n=1 Tax=Allobranchiibius sp. CTAmp26 TaxID=2815214 RepID=UPI0027DB59B5|nr:MFS transporter [Allobranchiibius sp. CTAmp26]